MYRSLLSPAFLSTVAGLLTLRTSISGQKFALNDFPLPAQCHHKNGNIDIIRGHDWRQLRLTLPDYAYIFIYMHNQAQNVAEHVLLPSAIHILNI